MYRHAPADKRVHQTNQVRLGITCRAGVLSRLSHLAAEGKTYRETFRLEDYTPGVTFSTESILERLVLRYDY